jgi:hypothetical protein
MATEEFTLNESRNGCHHIRSSLGCKAPELFLEKISQLLERRIEALGAHRGFARLFFG